MGSRLTTMNEIEKNVRVCQRCRLYQTAANPVPGEGSVDSEVVFIGEAPGHTEDLTGRPFVGRAGKLLENLLKKIGYERNDVWIGNVIKHRPPENRDPLPDEISACMPYLTLQLKTINPDLIVTLGRYSMSYFYKDGKISRDHGRLIRTHDYNVYPVYHPAAALRSPDMMRALMSDFMKIPEILKSCKEGAGSDTGSKSEPDKRGQLGLRF